MFFPNVMSGMLPVWCQILCKSRYVYVIHVDLKTSGVSKGWQQSTQWAQSLNRRREEQLQGIWFNPKCYILNIKTSGCSGFPWRALSCQELKLHQTKGLVISLQGSDGLCYLVFYSEVFIKTAMSIAKEMPIMEGRLQWINCSD